MADSTEYLKEIARNTSQPTYSNSASAISIVPNIQIITLVTSNTEYVQPFINTRLLEIFCRSLVEIRYAFNTGDIAAGKYRTVPTGVSQPINFPSGYQWTGTLYLASASPNAIVEIETWQ